MTVVHGPRPFRRLAGLALATAAIAALAGAAGCSSDDTATTTVAPAETAAPDTTSVDPATTEVTDTTENPWPNGLRDIRYCEVLLLNLVDAQFHADVWNSMGFGDCPQEQWDALDAATIAKDRGVLIALLNGPRHWMLDHIDSDIRGTAPTTEFGGIGMFRAATIDLGNSLPSTVPYTERPITRETVFRWDAGTEVYQLVSPDGKVYTMQSYSQMVDPSMSAAGLPTLATKLGLPTGWTYNVVTLTTELRAISIDGVATVVQDEFQNTYQRIDAAP